MRNSLYITMLKIGLIGFGGGNALVPVMEQEIVKNKQAVTKEDFDKDVVVANITPGALTSKVVTGVGMQEGGMKGVIIYPLLMALPGAVLTVFLLSIMTGLEEQMLTGIEYLALGVTSFVVFVLGHYVTSTLKSLEQGRERLLGACMVAAVFLLSCEKEIYGILGVDKNPVFDISAMHILMTALFVIAYLNDSINRNKLMLCAAVAGTYLLVVGKNTWLSGTPFKVMLPIVMVLLVAFEVRREWVRKGNSGSIKLHGLWKELLVWLLFVIVLSLPALLFVQGMPEVLAKGLFSSYISFGGGDAYLSVADGLFVQGGYISEADFFQRIVPVINTLPGSILCKALAGIGFCYGYATEQSVMAGIVASVAGFACSVAASGSVFCVVMHLYESLEGFTLFQMIKKWIRPVMAGLLLSVAVGIFQGNLKMGITHGFSGGQVLTLTLTIVLLNIVVAAKTRKSGLFLVVPSAMISFVCCMVFGG